ncbi:Nucleic acid dioxygenase ALKBH1 [Sarcoptes scabiei]|uniref:DNA oxidative demethylase ALKBH1 n=1 Tax=Sarcoptes scabiei TaxID=52283 RepID=A0A834VHH8_SARSC|nr:Nucleic acid dioxygenase ALKBH1 [Sarcoptes scabiei]
MDSDVDVYKKTFKLYKNWQPDSSLPLLAPGEDIDTNIFELFRLNQKLNLPDDCQYRDHFHSSDQWLSYRTIKSIDGLMIIKNIFKPQYRSDWFEWFLDELPLKSNDLNLKSNIDLKQCHSSNAKINLRWITFGYHHDWDRKIYDLEQKVIKIPDRIEICCKIIAKALRIEFKPEAGIVNYYPRSSSLGFHTDHSEPNQQAPLFSFSFGSSAIFLIGGPEKSSSKPILPIRLDDGDLVVMSGESRKALHSIPKVLTEITKPPGTSSSKKIFRINLNVRQMFFSDCKC